MNLQRAVFKVELKKQKSEEAAHARDPKLPTLTRVRIRWIVICPDLRNT